MPYRTSVAPMTRTLVLRTPHRLAWIGVVFLGLVPALTGVFFYGTLGFDCERRDDADLHCVMHSSRIVGHDDVALVLRDPVIEIQSVGSGKDEHSELSISDPATGARWRSGRGGDVWEVRSELRACLDDATRARCRAATSNSSYMLFALPSGALGALFLVPFVFATIALVGDRGARELRRVYRIGTVTLWTRRIAPDDVTDVEIIEEKGDSVTFGVVASLHGGKSVRLTGFRTRDAADVARKKVRELIAWLRHETITPDE